MRQSLPLAILVLVALHVGAAVGQEKTQLSVRILAGDRCLVYLLHVPCPDVGAKLVELGTPSNVDIHVNVTSDANDDAIDSALTSLKRAGFQFKLTRISVAAPAR
jgi:hypothetical protein